MDGVVGDLTWWVPAGAAGATLASLAGLHVIYGLLPLLVSFIAARAECGVYLGLGYRLMRLREKFQVAEIEI